VIELWFPHDNKYCFRLRSPTGFWSPVADANHGSFSEFLPNGNLVTLVLTPYHTDNSDASLHVEVAPGRAAAVENGEWILEITGVRVPLRQPIHAWVEWMSDREVFFQDYVDDEVTITIPGTAEHVITVGAIEVADVMRSFEQSSWGPSRKGVEKPDLVAPGVGLHGAGAERTDLRSLERESGTSLAAPHVAGAVALALSACVKSGRPVHHSRRIRAALLDTARHRSTDWSPETGWGELDARAFFENLLK
jgi:subtilisin family serine protease